MDRQELLKNDGFESNSRPETTHLPRKKAGTNESWLRREARYQNDQWMDITNLPPKPALVHYTPCPIAHREITKAVMHSSTYKRYWRTTSAVRHRKSAKGDERSFFRRDVYDKEADFRCAVSQFTRATTQR